MTAAVDESKVQAVITRVFEGLDSDIASYLASVVVEDPWQKPEELEGSVGPFLLSSEFATDEDDVLKHCELLAAALETAFGPAASGDRKKEGHDTPALLSAPLSFKETKSAGEDRMVDLLWGKDKVRSARNEVMRSSATISKRQERKQRQLIEADESSDEEEEQVSMMILPDYSSGSGEKDINVLGFCLRFAGQELLSSADLRLAYGRRYGLVGKNGIGKTTLLKHIAAFEIEGMPRHHRILHVKQEVRSSEKSVLDTVLQSDVEREALLAEEKEIVARQQEKPDAANGGLSTEEVQALSKRLNEIYQRLSIIGATSAESRAAVILAGLQFSAQMQHAPVSSLSGGWRMRVALASALFIEPDLLLLDEPTNHLDLEAVLWLQQYLQGYKHTVLLVSHDRAFLNEVATDIVHFADQTLTYYRGNYDTFEAVRDEKIKNQRRLYEANLAKRTHMMDFIEKFRCNANRAALVQSRIKALEKMEVVEEPHKDPPFKFHLPTPEPLGRPILSIERVSFGYPERDVSEAKAAVTTADGSAEEGKAPTPAPPRPPSDMLFVDADFGVDLETRIGIVGHNGAGKSTLLSLILGKLRPVKGNVFRHQNLRIASFTQHHTDQFDLRLSATENFEVMYPSTDPQDLRTLLGRFGLSGPDAMKPMRFLSGGQKSRAAWKRPHIVILDEPTNHLDMETIHALIEALQEFRGGLLVVSHDQHFITKVCKDIYAIEDCKVKRFPGSFDDYKQQTLARHKKK